MSTEPARVW